MPDLSSEHEPGLSSGQERQVTRLTQDQGNNQEPSFSPNGRLIVFSSNRSGASMLWVMTSEGQNQKMLPLEKGDYSTPDWGP